MTDGPLDDVTHSPNVGVDRLPAQSRIDHHIAKLLELLRSEMANTQHPHFSADAPQSTTEIVRFFRRLTIRPAIVGFGVFHEPNGQPA